MATLKDLKVGTKVTYPGYKGENPGKVVAHEKAASVCDGDNVVVDFDGRRVRFVWEQLADLEVA